MTSGRIYGSSGRGSNPLAVIAVVSGAIGAACSIFLWLHLISPDSAFLRSVADHLGGTAVVSSRLGVIALVGGLIAIGLAVLSSLGGSRSGGGVAVAIVLGVIAVSYPILETLDVVSKVVKNPIP